MTFSKVTLKKRINRFRTLFKTWKVDGFVVEQPTDLLYFTGLKLSRGRLLIGPTTAALFVDGRYFESAEKQSPIPVKKLEEETFCRQLKEWKHAKVYGFDTGLTVAAHKGLKKQFLRQSKTFRGFELPTQKVRAIKESGELAKLKKSAALLHKGFLFIKKQLKTGIEEEKVARGFELYVKKIGAEALSFEPIIAFGENSALPHYHPGKRKLKKGDVVLIDIGVVVEGYASDMTRIVFWGEVPKRIQEIYKVVREAQRVAIEACRAGTRISDLEKMAREVMGKEEKYFVHALGHGIGLDVHEYPRVAPSSKDRLEEGMVITIEPGIYLPKVGGIRYEDMVLITKKGHRKITKA